MSYFIKLFGENGQPFLLNADHIECVDVGDEHYTHVYMNSGQIVRAQNSVSDIENLLPTNVRGEGK